MNVIVQSSMSKVLFKKEDHNAKLQVRNESNSLKLNKYIYCNFLALNTTNYKNSKTRRFCQIEVLMVTLSAVIR